MSSYIYNILFFAILFMGFGLMQWHIARAFINWVNRSIDESRRLQWKRMGLLFLIFANLVFSARFLLTELGLYDNLFVQALIIYPGGIFFAGITLAFSTSVLVEGFRYVYKGIQFIANYIRRNYEPGTEQTEYNPARRKFMKTAGTALVAAPFVVSMSSSAATSRDYRITRPELFFPDLPAGLDGFSIVQISDLHSGIYMTEHQIREIFEIGNSLNPQLIALTGDLVDTSVSEIPAIYNTLPLLKADYGVYSCLGNHDHYASGSAVTSAVRQRNIPMLNNNHQTLKVNGESLDIVGVDDAGNNSRNFARPQQALQGTDPQHFKVLLSHRPDLFNSKLTDSVDLTLSGHTHGGQIGGRFFGVPIYPASLFHEYPKGLYQNGDRKLYVNVGVGMVGVPIRMVRPEITQITLRRGLPSEDVPGIGS